MKPEILRPSPPMLNPMPALTFCSPDLLHKLLFSETIALHELIFLEAHTQKMSDNIISLLQECPLKSSSRKWLACFPAPRRNLRERHQHGARGCTHVEGLEAVPAEGVLAVLAHHLCTALVPFYVHLALGAALDGRIVLFQFEGRTAGEIL